MKGIAIKVGGGLIAAIGLVLVLRGTSRGPAPFVTEAVTSEEDGIAESPSVAPGARFPRPRASTNSAITPRRDDAPDPLLGEPALMDRLRRIQDSDPSLAYDLAREGQRRFPNSSDAAERAAVAVKSLARQGKLAEARAEAEIMVNAYPGSPWALEVERNTGAHPGRH